MSATSAVRQKKQCKPVEEAQPPFTGAATESQPRQRHIPGTFQVEKEWSLVGHDEWSMEDQDMTVRKGES